MPVSATELDADSGYPATVATIDVYTTRPDTLFGATYVVLAPEHPLVDEITTSRLARRVSLMPGRAERQCLPTRWPPIGGRRR